MTWTFDTCNLDTLSSAQFKPFGTLPPIEKLRSGVLGDGLGDGLGDHAGLQLRGALALDASTISVCAAVALCTMSTFRLSIAR